MITNKLQMQTHANVPIRIKRAYCEPDAHDGFRALVDRLWPRGLKKSAARIDGWWKECAPSTALRKWFSHDATKWNGFKQRYRDELELKRAEVAAAVGQAENGPITLIYAAKDEQHNHAIVLKAFIEDRILR